MTEIAVRWQALQSFILSLENPVFFADKYLFRVEADRISYTAAPVAPKYTGYGLGLCVYQPKATFTLKKI